MTAGFSSANLIHAWLNVLRGGGNGVTFTAPANVYLQWYVGDPGASGTANTAAVTTRSAVTFGAATSNAIALSNSPTYTATGTETLTHVALWSATTAGTFYASFVLTVSKAVVASDVVTQNTLSISMSPVAA